MASLPVALVWPYLLTPWRSPLVRWRLETYGVRGPCGELLAASSITVGVFLGFVRANRRALWRFWRWAAAL